MTFTSTDEDSRCGDDINLGKMILIILKICYRSENKQNNSRSPMPSSTHVLSHEPSEFGGRYNSKLSGF
jgi:hypothetical protein